MIGLDTNVVLRWLSADEGISGHSAEQAALVEQAVKDSDDGCFVNAVVVAETLWVVSNTYLQPKAKQIEIVERLLSAKDVSLSDREAIEDALEDFRDGGQGGFADVLIGTLNTRAGCATTLTFDKRAARGPHFTLLT